MSSKFAFARKPQPTPKVCRKAPPLMPIEFQLWPLQTLAAYAAWRSTFAGDPFLDVVHFTISTLVYPKSWEGFSAASGRRYYAHMIRFTAEGPFQFTLTRYQDNIPVKTIIWNTIPVDTTKPFNSRLLTRGPPDLADLCQLLITE